MRTQVVNYQVADKASELNVYFQNGTFWLTLSNMARLFGCDDKSIYRVVKEILSSGSLDKSSVNQHIEVPVQSGKRYQANSYSIDVVMAVGYRLNIKEATRFRIWSSFVSKNYLLSEVDREYTLFLGIKKWIKGIF